MCACACVYMCSTVDLPLVWISLKVVDERAINFSLGPVRALSFAAPSVPCHPRYSEEGQPVEVMAS